MNTAPRPPWKTRAPDSDYELLQPHFNEREIAELSVVVAMMNAWNRMGIGMRNGSGAQAAAGGLIGQ